MIKKGNFYDKNLIILDLLNFTKKKLIKSIKILQEEIESNRKRIINLFDFDT